MKKMICVLTLVAMSQYALADSGSGCGLGKLVYSGQTGLSAHTAAATTNGTSGTQLFGLTFGTSGCDDPGVVSIEHQRKVFVAMNMDDLAQDIAQGNGTYITSMASLLGISEKDDREAFFQAVQANYAAIFPSVGVNHDDVLNAMNETIKHDAQLSRFITQS